mgnify:CR=1 FL=1
MFRSARLKLTAWYLLIIMLISIIFSVVTYASMTRELKRGFKQAEMRFRAEELGIPFPRHFSGRWEDISLKLKEMDPRFFFTEDIQTAEKRLRLNLLIINGTIWSFSAIAGYFLAGKTLKPIETAMKEQKRFIADTSHELRTPLTALKTSMEVALRDKKMSVNQAKKLIKSNLEDIENMHLLTNNLLDLTNYQNNGSHLNFEKIDLAEVIETTYKKILPLAKKKGVDIKLKTQNCIIEADKTSLKEMVLIFLDNAVKYTRKGGKVTISTQVDKKCAFIKIEDTGVGISKQDVPHIFDRFYRVDQSRSKNNVSGFGLGLSLAKRIIEIHKGTITVNSTLGEGTTFSIKLPLKHS